MEVPDDTNITGWLCCVTQSRTMFEHLHSARPELEGPIVETVSRCACSCCAGGYAHPTRNHQGDLQDTQHKEVSASGNSFPSPS